LSCGAGCRRAGRQPSPLGRCLAVGPCVLAVGRPASAGKALTSSGLISTGPSSTGLSSTSLIREPRPGAGPRHREAPSSLEESAQALAGLLGVPAIRIPLHPSEARSRPGRPRPA